MVLGDFIFRRLLRPDALGAATIRRADLNGENL
jgi:hypothetical protein